MLLQNMCQTNQLPISVSSGPATLGGAPNNTAGWSRRWGTSRNRFLSDAGLNQKYAIPNGYNPHYSPEPAVKPGGISAFETTEGIATAVISLSGGKNAVGTINGTSTADATGGLIVSMDGTIDGVATASADIAGVLWAEGQSDGEATVEADLGAIAGGEGEANGTAVGTATLTALGYLSGTIYVNQSEAEVTQIVSGVWDALVADYDASGSMGEAMGAAGTAGDPWTTELPGSYTGDQAGALIYNISSDSSTAAEIAAAVHAYTIESNGNYSAADIQRIVLAVLAGVTTNGGKTFKTPDGSTTRVQATVNETARERTAITITS